ncbi:hypothetical protein ED92_39345 [Amycolatopsis sp. MJM2582]|uniref:hypothetical protein n=1 Tax=Amycolatopsis sp. MJM2582 TaxID=1427749 RepID=UPI000502EE98|nr:hypothetical protein [Amycolatopsis sp. MJM2582]KFZ77132.1 hypothetical protein ED92_39345 [Amycolatopsis sp. MJM2582]
MTVKAPFPTCPDCHSPLTLQYDADFYDTKYVYCLNAGCAYDGISAGSVVSQEGQPARGWPRQNIDGRPVPWLAPIIGDRVAWAALNSGRLDEADQCWLCQVCGCSLASNPSAWIAVSQGEVAAGGAMHRRCMHLARTVCPELRNDQSYVFVEVHQSERANDWEAAVARLSAYEERHGQIPRLLPLQA